MDRLPPGQRWVTGVPVLHHGPIPPIDQANWRFVIKDHAGKNLYLSLDEFKGLPQTTIVSDFHCVTGWSTMDVEWDGVLARTLIDLFNPSPSTRFVMVHAYGGYSANIPMEVFEREDCVFALKMNKSALSPEHGAPIRFVAPIRYAYKSVKWVCGLEFMDNDRRGYWEERGYHNNADPWEEERHS